MGDLATWRYIPLLNASGAIQMALDQWLLEQHQAGQHPPTLRFYTWSPIAISLGRHQYQYPDAWRQLVWQGQPVDVVRRPSGGRAVLHQGDLTYAIVTSGIPGNRMQVYQTLCEFLIQGWRSLGVELMYGQAGRGYIHNPNCFGTATGADLVTSTGAKLIGSAQLRRGSVVLQHGSIRLNADPTLTQQVFGTAIALPEKADSLSRPDHIQSLIAALVDAACQCFGIHLVTQPLSDLEWQAVQALVEPFRRLDFPTSNINPS